MHQDVPGILYEDNHLIIVNKRPSDIVQGDKTGDISLDEILKAYIKKKYHKPGEVFLGTVHRLDRPASGIVVFARTSKALSRMNELFRIGEIKKTYWAIVNEAPPAKSGHLEHYLTRNTKQNKSYAHDKEVKGAKKAILDYRLIAKSNYYCLVEIDLKTGRHHQIRCQLAAIGCPIKGDLKYGARRSNKDGSISLHAREISFLHPVKKTLIKLIARPPEDELWNYFLRLSG
ncbi:MAG: RluA family pseudouridine synthase [Bacteroidota bacterium]